MAMTSDTKTRDHIAEHGCTVIHVLEEGDLPPFTYSIGVMQETGEPEVVVIGLQRELAHFIVNQYNIRVRSGERFLAGGHYAGFLEGFDVCAIEVPPSEYDEYVGQALDYYGGAQFRLLQLVYPTTSGLWPWSEGAPEGFRKWQPVLGPSDGIDSV